MKCEVCEKEFEQKYKSQRFCSRKCVSIYSNKEAKKLRISRYYENPKICKCCGKIIPFESKQNIFCNKSCAATYNNKHNTTTKKWSNESRQHMKEIMLLRYYNQPYRPINCCKYCGNIINDNSKRVVCDVCKPYTKYSLLINKICKSHPEYNIGGLKDIYEKIEKEVIDRYFVAKDSTLMISNYFNIDDTTVAHIIRRAGKTVRNLKESQFNAIEYNRNNINNIIDSKLYKTGIHKSWEGKEFYYRSSYEDEYMNYLDSQKIKYEYEPFYIKYFNSKLQEYRFAKPDFYLKDTNTIVEIKSNWTLFGKLVEMRDKFKKYEDLGYKTVLILDGKEVNIHKLEEKNNKIIVKN